MDFFPGFQINDRSHGIQNMNLDQRFDSPPPRFAGTRVFDLIELTRRYALSSIRL
jgi:hypothetical protein